MITENKRLSDISGSKNDKDIIGQIEDIIKRKDNFLITTHVRSDADAISSEIALYLMLRDMGKRVYIVNDSEAPKAINFLFNHKESLRKDSGLKSASTDIPIVNFFKASEYQGNDSLNGNFEVVIVVDSPSIKRSGKTADIIPRDAIIINIDHHISNERFGNINLVSSDACATGEIVYDYLVGANHKITPQIAEALYTSIINDTGRFTHANTTSKSLTVASHLIELGADPAKIARHLYQFNTLGILRLQAMAIETLKFAANGRIAIMWITKDMLKKTETRVADIQDFPEIPFSVENVSVGILLREMDEPNYIKVSLRSKDIDVNRIAKKYGGGGHVQASGCEINGTLQEVHEKIVNEVSEGLS